MLQLLSCHYAYALLQPCLTPLRLHALINTRLCSIASAVATWVCFAFKDAADPQLLLIQFRWRVVNMLTMYCCVSCCIADLSRQDCDRGTVREGERRLHEERPGPRSCWACPKSAIMICSESRIAHPRLYCKHNRTAALLHRDTCIHHVPVTVSA